MTHRIAGAALAAWSIGFTLGAHALGTPAGTAITNQAEISFDLAGVTQVLSSNLAVVEVAEILDVNVLLQTPERLVAAGDTGQPLLYRVTNTGNGVEGFALGQRAILPGDAFDPTPASPAIYFDTDSSGDLSAADIPYRPGGNDPVLAPDESISILLVNDIPPGVLDGQRATVELSATALSGTGAPGSAIAGAGDGGVDAVLGASGGVGAVAGQYLVGEVSLALAKSALVSDPDGGSEVVPGASILYTIEVVAEGTGKATNAVVADPIPPSTTYAAGSLRLNGLALSDAADADAGAFDASRGEITVALGALGAADGAQRIQFQVSID